MTVCTGQCQHLASVSAMGVAELVRAHFQCVCGGVGGGVMRDYGRLSGSDREVMGRVSGSYMRTTGWARAGGRRSVKGQSYRDSKDTLCQ